MTSRSRLTAFLIIGVLLVAIAVLASGVVRQSTLADSSRDFVIDAVPRLLSGAPRYAEMEDAEEVAAFIEPPSLAETFERLAHPTLLALQPPDVMSRYLQIVTLNLGQLEAVNNIRGSSSVPLFNFGSETPSASYELDVQFADGAAQVEIALLHEQGNWLISTLSVESNQLAD